MSYPRLENIQPIKAPIWAQGGHLQTIICHLLPYPKVKTPLAEHIIDLGDGDRLKIYVHVGKKPVFVTLFHGLGGDINSDYMQRTALVMEQLGFGYVLVNHRGSHTGLTLAKQPYHSGRGEDASAVFEWLSQNHPEHFLVGVGVSLSGAILLNLVAGRSGRIKPHALLTVNAPLDLQKGSIRLSQGLNRIYDFRFVQRLKHDLNLKYKLGLMDEKVEIPMMTTMHEFDAIYTGPATEFKTRENYYAHCSVKDHLTKVDRPTIMMTSKDDPFVDYVDYLESKKSSMIRTHIESTGGHVGYLGVDPNTGLPFRWIDYFMKEAVLDLVPESYKR